MILWLDGPHDPGENMRRDRALLERASQAAAEGRPVEAVLRLFSFEPPGITLGHAQRPERVLDLDRCRADGVPWAVRPTGGRAIFHEREWTYSLCAAIADPRWGGTLHEAYSTASRLIHASLARLGVPAALAAGRPRAGGIRDGAAARPPAEACFASTARHEIVLEGRKLVGSAQRRTSGALLQQGSILLGPGHQRLADYLAAAPGEREAVRRALGTRSALAGPFLGGPESALERWAEALAAELGEEARRLRGEPAMQLLTLPERGSYTEPSP